MGFMFQLYWLVILSWMFCAKSVRSQQCIQLTTSLCDEGSSTSSSNGLPGKAGPQGPPGLKGEPGESSNFDPSQLQLITNQLQNKTDDLSAKWKESSGSLEEIQSQISTITEQLNGVDAALQKIIQRLPPAFKIKATPRTGTFDEARAMCVEMGGDLLQHSLSISGIGKNYKEEIEEEANNRDFWIGITDQVQEGHWKYLNGDPYNKPSNELIYQWYAGEPNDSQGREDCAVLFYPLKQLNDVPCSKNVDRWIGICEIAE